MGGSFNPPHVGHLAIASDVCTMLDLEGVDLLAEIGGVPLEVNFVADLDPVGGDPESRDADLREIILDDAYLDLFHTVLPARKASRSSMCRLMPQL